MSEIGCIWFLPEYNDDNYNDYEDVVNDIDDDWFPFWGGLGDLGIKDLGIRWLGDWVFGGFPIGSGTECFSNH